METTPIPVFLIFLFRAKGHNSDIEIRELNDTVPTAPGYHPETPPFHFCSVLQNCSCPVIRQKIGVVGNSDQKQAGSAAHSLGSDQPQAAPEQALPALLVSTRRRAGDPLRGKRMIRLVYERPPGTGSF